MKYHMDVNYNEIEGLLQEAKNIGKKIIKIY
jgi:hypothetical protein